MVTVDYDRCKSCQICSTFCPKAVFDVDEYGRPLPARQEDCIGCRLCAMRCPDFAITVEG